MRYRLQRHDGTDCSATMVPITVLRMVPIQRYRQFKSLQRITIFANIWFSTHLTRTFLFLPFFLLLHLLVIFIKGLVSVPFLGSIHPQITHEAGKQEGDNGTKNGVERNPFIHIAAIFHSVPQPFKFRQYAF